MENNLLKLISRKIKKEMDKPNRNIELIANLFEICKDITEAKIY